MHCLPRIALLAAFALIAFAATASAATGPAFSFKTVASGLDRPVLVTAPRNSPDLYIVQQGGKVWRVHNGKRTQFLDMSTVVRFSSPSGFGLLGMAFDPNWDTNARLYVYYVARDANTSRASVAVARYDERNGVADPTTFTPVISIPEAIGPENHKGGTIAFGRDGDLYLATGDGPGGGDPLGLAQNCADLEGKVLRLDVRTLPYRIPAGNLVAVDAGCKPEVWALGLRNPWRWSFDRDTGEMWIGDDGQAAYEEIDHLPATAKAGTNFEWNAWEALHRYAGGAPMTHGTATGPVMEYAHDTAQNLQAVIGGVVYRGPDVPALRGLYLFTDFGNPQVRGFNLSPTTGKPQNGFVRPKHAGDPINVYSFSEDGLGSVYVITYADATWAANTGSIAKIVPAT